MLHRETGFDFSLVMVLSEVQRCFRRNDSRLFLVPSAARLRPPSVVFRFERQRRVYVDPNMLSTKYGKHDASKS